MTNKVLLDERVAVATKKCFVFLNFSQANSALKGFSILLPVNLVLAMLHLCGLRLYHSSYNKVKGPSMPGLLQFKRNNCLIPETVVR